MKGVLTLSFISNSIFGDFGLFSVALKSCVREICHINSTIVARLNKYCCVYLSQLQTVMDHRHGHGCLGLHFPAEGI